MNDRAKCDQIAVLTASIVSAYVSNNPLPIKGLSDLIGSVHESLTAVSRGRAKQASMPQKPAVSVKKSVHDDYIVCLEDGKKFKTLKRHLNEIHGLTAVEYRRKWNLPPDYPMIAPNYAVARSVFAKSKRLGYKKAAPVPTQRGRKKDVIGD